MGRGFLISRSVSEQRSGHSQPFGGSISFAAALCQGNAMRLIGCFSGHHDPAFLQQSFRVRGQLELEVAKMVC